MTWYIVQLHALGGLAELNVIYRRDRSFERWTVCFESPGKLLDTWQLRLLWARPEAKLTSARTGKDKVVKRYDSLLSCLSTSTRNNSQAINSLINEILPWVLFLCVLTVHHRCRVIIISAKKFRGWFFVENWGKSFIYFYIPPWGVTLFQKEGEN